MKTKIRYDSAESNGWRLKADSLFLARFRGRPCEICGKRDGFDGQRMRSCGHHLAEKGMHRKYRYDESMIIVLCHEHHSRFSRDMSPHADDTAAVARFYAWLRDNKPEQFEKLETVDHDPFDKSWTYREKYVELGGEIESKTGKLRDLKPKNHARKVREYEDQS